MMYLEPMASMSPIYPTRSRKRFRFPIVIAFVAAMTYLLAAVAANAVSSTFSELNPLLKAPFYLLPGLALLAMLRSGMPQPRRLPRPWYVLALCFSAALLVGTTVGGIKVAVGSSLPLYYIGDGLKFISSWLSFLSVSALAYLLCKDDDGGKERYRLIRLCLILAVVEAAAVVILAARLDYWQKIHLGAASAIGFGLLYAPSGTLVRVLVLLLGLSAAALSGKRAGLALPIIAVGATVLVMMPRAILLAGKARSLNKAHLRAFIVTASVVIICSFLISMFGDRFSSRFETMYQSLLTFVSEKLTGVEVTDQSMNSRYAEMDNIRQFYADHPLQVILGCGFGAETPMYKDSGVLGVDGRMHHVHAGWWVYLLRNGLLGVLLLLIYFFITIRTALIGIRYGIPTSPWLFFLLICQAAASYKSNTMLDSIEFTIPVLFGATLAALHQRSLRYSKHSHHRV